MVLEVNKLEVTGLSPVAAAVSVLRHPLLHAIVRRLVMGLVLLFVVTALTFVMVTLTPGDAALAILGNEATPEAYARLRHEMGLDLPLHEQYGNWVVGAISGDFGGSLYTGESVTHTINGRLPVTLSLMLGALLVSLTVGVGLGLFSAIRGGAAGRVVDALALGGFAVPSFWLGAILISLFAVNIELFPATGYVPFNESPVEWLRSLILPVIALSLHGIAAIAKQTREATLDALGSEYVRMAWANGISPSSIFFRHVLKNASVRVVTILGVQMVSLLGGTVIVESVFALPGLGSLAVGATIQHDLPVVQGLVIYFTVIVVVVNIVIDLAYTALNPKVRAQ